MNRNAIDEVLSKARRKAFDTDRPAELAAAVDDPELWDAVDLWVPILSEIAAVTDYLQSDTTPLYGVHLSFAYLSYFLLSITLYEETKTAIAGFLKSRYATVYDYIHVLSFYLDPLFVPAREASRRCKVKADEESRNDASRCLAAAAALTCEATVADQQAVQAAAIAVCMGGATYFCTATSTQSSVRVQLPQAWWALFCDISPICIRRLAQLVFSYAPTSAAIKGLSSSGRGCIRGFAIVSQVTTQTGHLPSCSTDNK
jgi:hypothetical protein